MATATGSTVIKLVKNPLFHFIVGGFAIFVLVFTNPQNNQTENDVHHIVVDREILLKQLQYMTKTFEPKQAEQRLDTMSEENLEKLVTQYVSEEALFREATTLGFGNDDYIIKNRMIEKMDFIVKGGSAADYEVSDAEIQTYYDANSSKFIEQGTVYFTHVFVKQDNTRTNEQVTQAIKNIALDLKSDNAAFIDAIKYGDRFPYGLNYIEKNREEITAHFGSNFTQQVFSISPDDTQWQGPFTSTMGQHLVMLTHRTPAKQLPLAAVSPTIKAELQRVKQMEARDLAITQLIESYTVKINEPLTIAKENTK